MCSFWYEAPDRMFRDCEMWSFMPQISRVVVREQTFHDCWPFDADFAIAAWAESFPRLHVSHLKTTRRRQLEEIRTCCCPSWVWQAFKGEGEDAPRFLFTFHGGGQLSSDTGTQPVHKQHVLRSLTVKTGVTLCPQSW